VEALLIAQYLERQRCAVVRVRIERIDRFRTDRIAAQLILDALERLLHAQPEVDLLARRARGNVAIELGDVLDFLDPRVDLGLNLVEEGRVGLKRGVDGLGRDARAARPALYAG
jgi:hypothetical protein